MELVELENIWKESNRRILENTRLNKEILRRMLTAKPEKRLNWMKIKAYYNLFSPILFVFVILIMDIQFRFTLNFYIGLGLFIPIYIINYVWDIKYFLLIRKIDFSDSILNIKKGIALIEKYNIKTSKIRCLLMPLVLLGVVLMLFPKPIFNTKTVAMMISIVLAFVLSTYYKFRYLIYERFRKLNKEIEEIENLMKE